MIGSFRHDFASAGLAAAITAAVVALSGASVAAQTYGLATMQPGTLNHTTGSAIAKVLKEKAGMNALVQPTAGESVLIPLVGRGEAELGIANALEVAVAVEAQRVLDTVSRAILAAGGLTEKDISPVLVPNVIRGADDFVAGAADTFYFAFGAPKVREVDATVGGIRVLEIPDSGMAAARKIFPEGYLSPAAPGPFFIGIDKPMGVYTWDNLLFTNAKVKDEQVYKIIEAMAKNKDDLVAIQPALRSFTAAGLYKNYGVPYHPGALKYFNDNKIEPTTTR